MSRTLVHPAGASLRVPDDWEVVEDADERGDVAIALEPPSGPEPGFRASLVLSAEPVAADVGGWQLLAEELLCRTLTDYLLLDRAEHRVAGRPGGRRLVHHVAHNGDAVSAEQWFAASGGTRWTLTATVDVLRYARLGAELARLADTLRLP